MSGHIIMMKLPITSCPQLQPSESSKQFPGRMFKLNAKFDADSLLYSVILNATVTQYTCSLSGVYTPIGVQYCEVVIVHTCAFQPTLFGCQVTSMSRKLFSRYINNGWAFSGQNSIYARYKSLIRCMIGKNFLPFSGLSFHVLHGAL